MTYQTLGLKNQHQSGHHLKPSMRNKIIALRKEGLTCQAISDLTGVGRSTVARYTSDWYQKHTTQSGIPTRGHPPKAVKQAAQKPEKKVKPEKKAEAPEPVVEKQLHPLSPEVLEYIDAIMRKHDEPVGNPIGNFFIRLGKFLGGHHPV